MEKRKNLLEIHAAVVLFGLAGLFGKWLIFSPVLIVLGRVFFASLALFLCMALCSRIFFTWLKACSKVLGSLVYMPNEEEVIGSKPKLFKNIPDLHSIIDCTEIFIETPKDLELQSATWSDYKHHNTLKVLVACLPNSSIIFTSAAYIMVGYLTRH